MSEELLQSEDPSMVFTPLGLGFLVYRIQSRTHPVIWDRIQYTFQGSVKPKSRIRVVQGSEA